MHLDFDTSPNKCPHQEFVWIVVIFKRSFCCETLGAISVYNTWKHHMSFPISGAKLEERRLSKGIVLPEFFLKIMKVCLGVTFGILTHAETSGMFIHMKHVFQSIFYCLIIWLSLVF